MTELRLSELYIYPVKSAAGIAVSEARLTERGLQYDRRWMVVEAQGKFMTQRRFPRMALMRVKIAEGHLQVTAPGMPMLMVLLDPCLELNSGGRNEPFDWVTVEVWGDRCKAIALGMESKQWFTQFIGVDCQLVYMPDSAHRPTAHGKWGDDKLVSFADAYPYLLISEASLAGLNEKLVAKEETPVTIERFRPNLVVKGCGEAHAEDSWQRIRIGEAVFDLPKLCDRCSIPNVDLKTGERTKEPTKTLSTYRYWDKGIWFGQNCIQHSDDSSTEAITLCIGDPVAVVV